MVAGRSYRSSATTSASNPNSLQYNRMQYTQQYRRLHTHGLVLAHRRNCRVCSFTRGTATCVPRLGLGRISTMTHDRSSVMLRPHSAAVACSHAAPARHSKTPRKHTWHMILYLCMASMLQLCRLDRRAPSCHISVALSCLQIPCFLKCPDPLTCFINHSIIPDVKSQFPTLALPPHTSQRPSGCVRALSSC